MAEDNSGSLVELIKGNDGEGFLKCLFFKCSGKFTEDNCGYLSTQLLF